MLCVALEKGEIVISGRGGDDEIVSKETVRRLGGF